MTKVIKIDLKVCFILLCYFFSSHATGASDRDKDKVIDSLDCAPKDKKRWKLLSVYKDLDNDGIGAGSKVKVCLGSSTKGYSNINGDCNDRNKDLSVGLSGYPDNDGDGVSASQRTALCLSKGQAKLKKFQVAGYDCDDGNPLEGRSCPKGRAACENTGHSQYQERTYFMASSVPHGATCKSEVQRRLCFDGKWDNWSGSYTSPSCNENRAATCDGVEHGQNQTRTMYKEARIKPGAECSRETQSRTCNNGAWTAWTGSLKEPVCENFKRSWSVTKLSEAPLPLSVTGPIAVTDKDYYFTDNSGKILRYQFNDGKVAEVQIKIEGREYPIGGSPLFDLGNFKVFSAFINNQYQLIKMDPQTGEFSLFVSKPTPAFPEGPLVPLFAVDEKLFFKIGNENNNLLYQVGLDGKMVALHDSRGALFYQNDLVVLSNDKKQIFINGKFPQTEANANYHVYEIATGQVHSIKAPTGMGGKPFYTKPINARALDKHIFWSAEGQGGSQSILAFNLENLKLSDPQTLNTASRNILLSIDKIGSLFLSSTWSASPTWNRSFVQTFTLTDDWKREELVDRAFYNLYANGEISILREDNNGGNIGASELYLATASNSGSIDLTGLGVSNVVWKFFGQHGNQVALGGTHSWDELYTFDLNTRSIVKSELSAYAELLTAVDGAVLYSAGGNSKVGVYDVVHQENNLISQSDPKLRDSLGVQYLGKLNSKTVYLRRYENGKYFLYELKLQ